FSAVILKSCGGQDCRELNFDKKWSVYAGKENADIVDVNDGKSYVTIQPKQAGTFIPLSPPPSPAPAGRPVPR
ncbi:MAG: hypothetical protein IPI66_14975, partial [Chitinophagaceae bacterium]|nr:hypothetical protein [Chitinophagaceae bacterium]